MLGILWLVPALPLAGFFLLVLIGSRLPRAVVAAVGAGAVGLSLLVTLILGGSFLASPPAGHAYSQDLWTWIAVGSFKPHVTLYLDALSLIMILVVTFVAFWIHLYSVEFMADEEGYSRFFAYMNLFVASMLVLVLAGDLLVLYVGWEGVGLCSYLLIGFWYLDPANGRAARKAFIVTRVGDTAMAIGLFLLYHNLGTLDIQQLMHRVTGWPIGSALPVAAAALLLGGALGKSAQLPLQTWLPDAMAGPTPVSALIHAATMVTAGVYLIARTHVLFAQAPAVQLTVAVIGAVTLLLAGFSALVQWDIKRVLAYSTISQIGYMFLALGVGAWSAAIFHLMVHAFFKALLFLGAGAIILALHHEHDMFKMGGLRRQLPLVFWTFLIASCSLAALPLVTAGFYSKDLIVEQAWTAPAGSPWLWAAGLIGALLTSIYTFRMVFVTFFGPPKQQVSRTPGLRIQIPLVVLAALSIGGGWVQLPRFFGNVPAFSDFLETGALPATIVSRGGANTEPPVGNALRGVPERGVAASMAIHGTPRRAFPTATPPRATQRDFVLEIVTAIVSLVGIYLAYLWFFRNPQFSDNLAHTPWGAQLRRLWFSDWGFDWLYDRLFVWPYAWLARIDRNDVVDLVYAAIAWVNRELYVVTSRTQTGRIRWYAAGIVLGAVIALIIVVLR